MNKCIFAAICVLLAVILPWWVGVIGAIVLAFVGASKTITGLR